MKPTLVALAVALASGALHADNELDTLLVEGQTELQTTDKARVSEAQGATTITSEDLVEAQASNLADALQNNASVQVDEVGGSRGSEITIRGQSGNAVSVRVEGAPNNRSQIMHKGSNDRDTIWLNMDMYESVTVIPGAAANTYGNGSTGGVVLLETKDPESIIREDRDWGQTYVTPMRQMANQTVSVLMWLSSSTTNSLQMRPSQPRILTPTKMQMASRQTMAALVQTI